MQIKIVSFFSMEKEGGKVVGNGVLNVGRALNKYTKTEALKMIDQRSNLCQRHIPMMRLIQRRTAYRTRYNFITRVSTISDNKTSPLTKNWLYIKSIFIYLYFYGGSKITTQEKLMIS